ncbi:MAG: ABC transporter permease [SAR324 cluster bacterium]|nr:ABC transporter permease [SAR324 cluster bacterium]
MRNNLNRFRAFWRHFPAAGAINLALIILCILLIWELISSTIDNPSRYLPSPILVALSSVDMIYKGLLPSYFGDTLIRLITGSSIGLALGIPFGLIIGINRTSADIFYPVMNFFQSVSGIAIFPIVVIWWGNSDTTVLVVILYTSFFPIAFTVLSGVREVPMQYIHAARTMGATRFQVIRDVLLPGSMPHIATGSRLSIGFAWRAVIAGEMLAGREGLGWMIFTAQDADKTSEVILGMVMIGVSWIVLDHYLLRPLEADTIERWGLVQR